MSALHSLKHKTRKARPLFWMLLLIPTLVGAQSSGGIFRLERERITSGGGKTSSGVFELQGSIAQPETSNGINNGGVISGGNYQVTGGFHRREAAVQSNNIFANGFE